MQNTNSGNIDDPVQAVSKLREIKEFVKSELEEAYELHNTFNPERITLLTELWKLLCAD